MMDLQIRRRNSNRLTGYDYAQPGAYFITLCSYRRKPIFGVISDGQMILSKCGETVEGEWLRTGLLRAYLELDCFVVMPNHFHAIVLFNNAWDERIEPIERTRRQKGELGSVIAGFKASVTRRIHANALLSGHPVWQRNYYDHIIRGEEEYDKIREYIVNNPLKWELDRFYS